MRELFIKMGLGRQGFKKILSFLIFIVFSSLSFGVSSEELKGEGKYTFSDSLIQQVIEVENEITVKKADKFLSIQPRTVTSNLCSRSLGGKHDFFSEGPYWWPDPANPDGPYIRHDGIRNPGRFENHDDDLRFFSWIVGTETSAYILTGEEKYAKAAMVQMKAWFVDTATLMNPNMLYAQAIQGICSGRGIGIIDAIPLIDVARSVMILEESKYVSGGEITAIKEWFRQFVTWLTTHQYGIDEMNWKNNHGTWWHTQVATYARLIGDQELLQLCQNHFVEVLLPNQMAKDGSFPFELERTKPYSYSLFNLDAMTSLVWMIHDDSFDSWNFTLNDGRGIKKGLGFMMPYILDISKWPYKKDVSNWEKQPGQRQFMLLAALAENNKEWFSMWLSLGKNNNDESRISSPLKNPLLWLEIKNGKFKF